MNEGMAWRLFFAAVFVGVAYVVFTTHAFAAGPFGVGTPDPQGGGFSGPFGSFFLWAAQKHAAFQAMLRDALNQFKENKHAAWLLIGVSFGYGVFHAVGPGHGKTVITSYLLATGQTIKHGVTIAFGAAFMQGLVAIAIVSTVTIILKGLFTIPALAMDTAQNWFTTGGFGLIALLGAWLLWRKITERDEEEPLVECAGTGANRRGQGSVQVSAKQAWSTILAVGVRPCSGSLILITFAFKLGLYITGLASVLLVSLGTAITVSSLVFLAVSIRGMALRYADTNTRLVSHTLRIVEIGLALFILLFGLLLFSGAIIHQFAM
jgi:ABC-type nickel/cobalt efflux system permease component RcnA